jgi:hypothetical protein
MHEKDFMIQNFSLIGVMQALEKDLFRFQIRDA